MIGDEVQVKAQKVVKEPRISLTMISRYIVATEAGKSRILRGCKYPADYIPRFYEMARRLVCELFAGNFINQHELYFEEFQRQSKVFREEAKAYPENKDGYKNRIYSAKGLDAVVAMSDRLIPILEKHILNSNLHHRKDNIIKNGVRIGAMADMLLSDEAGINQIGFLKFNFASVKLRKGEAEAKLYVLKRFFEKEGLSLDPKCCYLIDVVAWRIYTLVESGDAEMDIDLATKEICANWELI